MTIRYRMPGKPTVLRIPSINFTSCSVIRIDTSDGVKDRVPFDSAELPWCTNRYILTTSAETQCTSSLWCVSVGYVSQHDWVRGVSRWDSMFSYFNIRLISATYINVRHEKPRHSVDFKPESITHVLSAFKNRHRCLYRIYFIAIPVSYI